MNINIKLYKQNIVNDVAAECNLLGRTLEITGNTDDNKTSPLKELAGYIKSPSDNETKPVVARALNEGFDIVKESCQRFITTGRNFDDNRLESLFDNISNIDMENIDFEMLTKKESYSMEVAGMKCVTLDTIPTTEGCIYDFKIPALASAGLSENNSRIYLIVGYEVVKEIEITNHTTIISYRCGSTDPNTTVFIGVEDIKNIPNNLTGNEHIIRDIRIIEKRFGELELNLELDNFNPGVTSSVKSYAHRLIVDHIMAAVLKNQSSADYTKYITTENMAKDNLVRALQARNSFGRSHHDWM